MPLSRKRSRPVQGSTQLDLFLTAGVPGVPRPPVAKAPTPPPARAVRTLAVASRRLSKLAHELVGLEQERPTTDSTDTRDHAEALTATRTALDAVKKELSTRGVSQATIDQHYRNATRRFRSRVDRKMNGSSKPTPRIEKNPHDLAARIAQLPPRQVKHYCGYLVAFTFARHHAANWDILTSRYSGAVDAVGRLHGYFDFFSRSSLEGSHQYIPKKTLTEQRAREIVSDCLSILGHLEVPYIDVLNHLDRHLE